jgi:hypothetical protein
MTKNAADEPSKNHTNDADSAPDMPQSRRQEVHDVLLDASDELSPVSNEANGSGNSEIDESLLDSVTGGMVFTSQPAVRPPPKVW